MQTSKGHEDIVTTRGFIDLFISLADSRSLSGLLFLFPFSVCHVSIYTDLSTLTLE